MSEEIHLVAKNATTKKYPTIATPLEQVSTACRAKWDARPRSTFYLKSLTCPACVLFALAHKLTGVWWKAAA